MKLFLKLRQIFLILIDPLPLPKASKRLGLGSDRCDIGSNRKRCGLELEKLLSDEFLKFGLRNRSAERYKHGISTLAQYPQHKQSPTWSNNRPCQIPWPPEARQEMWWPSKQRLEFAPHPSPSRSLVSSGWLQDHSSRASLKLKRKEKGVKIMRESAKQKKTETIPR